MTICWKLNLNLLPEINAFALEDISQKSKVMKLIIFEGLYSLQSCYYIQLKKPIIYDIIMEQA